MSAAFAWVLTISRSRRHDGKDFREDLSPLEFQFAVNVLDASRSYLHRTAARRVVLSRS